MTPPRPSLETLKREWYAKLKAEGFQDVEYGSEDGPLRVANRENRGGVSADELDATHEYYSRCTEFLYEHSFAEGRDRELWALHAEGVSIGDIALRLGMAKATTGRAVQRLGGAMEAWRRQTSGEARHGAPEALPEPMVEVSPNTVVSDDEWERVRRHLPRPRTRPYRNDRGVLAALVWLGRTGAVRRMLPSGFPPHDTVYSRLRAWRKSGAWGELLQKIAQISTSLFRALSALVRDGRTRL